MEITEIKNEKSDLHLKVVIRKKDMDLEINKELSDIAKKVKIDGFRIGHVPLSMVTKKYGQSVKSDIVQKNLEKAIQKIIKERDLNIASSPQIDEVKMENDLEFTLKFELMPDIILPDFKKFSLEKPILELVDKDIDVELTKIAKASTEYSKESKSKIAEGDQVTIDAIGYVDGEAFENGKLDNYKLIIGSKVFIDNFEQQLIGLKTGQNADVKVKFPEDYHSENLSGKDAEFKVKIIAVHKGEAPKIDDDLAKKFACKDLTELKERLTQSIALKFDPAIYTMMKMKLFDQLENALNFEMPLSPLDKEYKALKEELLKNADEDSDLKGKSEQEIDAYAKRIAKRRLGIALLLGEYVKSNKIEIDQDDIRGALRIEAMKYPGQEKMIFDFYKNNPQALAALRSSLLEDKAVKDIIANKITVKEKKYNGDKLEKFLAEETDKVSISGL